MRLCRVHVYICRDASGVRSTGITVYKRNGIRGFLLTPIEVYNGCLEGATIWTLKGFPINGAVLPACSDYDLILELVEPPIG